MANDGDPASGRVLHGAVPAFVFQNTFYERKELQKMKQNEVVCNETKDLFIDAYRLSNSLDFMDHALDFLEVEISLEHETDRARIGNLIKVVESFFKEANERLIAIENGLTEGGSSECPER